MVYRQDKTEENLLHRGLFKRTALAACVMALSSSPSFAQEEGADLEEVIVTGTRANLQNAQDIKREADTFVDAISAKDIGSLPDRSVLEAIQRLPGVSVERFAGPDDPDHFSVEGSGAVIRGMTQTRSEFNGRDSFTANSGRGLSFQDVSPELMGGVDVYKNQTADMIEGGIGGTISLKTRKPFDADGRVLSFSGDMSRGDMAKEWTPTISGLFSDRWDTSVGEFGLLLNAADSSLRGRSHGIQSDAYVQYNAADIRGAEEFIDGDGIVWMPNGSNLLDKDDDRHRSGFAATVQWENPDDTLLATFEYIRSEATLAWTERALKYQGGYYDEDAQTDIRRTRPADAFINNNIHGVNEDTEFEFSNDGVFEAGFLTDTDGWRVADDNIDHVARASWSDNGQDQFGHKFQTDTRVKKTNTLVEDFSINLKWSPTEQIDVEWDAQYIQAESRDDDVVVMLGIYALQDYDTRGDTPTLNIYEPWGGVRDAARASGDDRFETYPTAAFTDYPGFSGDPDGDANYFQDSNNYWWRSAMDHYERSEGDSFATRLDGTYHFEDVPFVRSVKAGVRYAKREQLVRATGWNWGSLGPEFSGGNRAHWLAETPGQQDDWELVDWSDFHGGGVANIPGGQLAHASEDFVKSLVAGRGGSAELSDAGNWQPYQDRSNVDDEYGLFSPGEIYKTTETNNAAYVRVDFGSDDFAMRFSGNIGLRYVSLDREAQGSIQFPDLVPDHAVPSDWSMPLDRDAVVAFVDTEVAATGVMDNIPDPGNDPDSAEWQEYEDRVVAIDQAYAAVLSANEWIGDARNWLTQEERNFANDQEVLSVQEANFDMLLPSLNLKVEVTDDLVARFAVSKAVALPDMEQVKNQAALGNLEVQESRYEVPNPDPDAAPEPTPIRTADLRLLTEAYVPGWTGDGGNPQLKPMESVQWDLSLEWYFSDVGSLTTSLFHKDLENFFISGAFPKSYTNPSGVSQVADVTHTINSGTGKMDGVEIAYQQFYDMLPEPFDGFGIQATYTYIEASGIPNNQLSPDEDGFTDTVNDTGARVALEDVPLQGQSKHTANFVLMYEKYDWNARLAYNWRSKYLLTTRDVISKYPLWYDDHGQLDGSIFYDVNDNVTVGVQLNNITNSQSETIMILDGKGTEAGRSWFVQDRRASLVVRANF
ncbi:TonB-dependent receptor [Saccharophagus degradans]|uniref:TonB-dependent receptor n=1 Tax=Saccharophagus degradans TaxID=86304 RepID=A0AAW7XBI0_9GAMM|nr:TonB-dependent receptor [Saccharophagus degradans]MBU2985503.1 TonB-dependent receptor [Saccharophagus degradans]MDO6423941.1 TonB-dependent receptor [Saccharophagus degradans]MDO6609220.1 TonB-dependent receptor [Saccharophagus degradans]